MYEVKSIIAERLTDVIKKETEQCCECQPVDSLHSLCAQPSQASEVQEKKNKLVNLRTFQFYRNKLASGQHPVNSSTLSKLLSFNIQELQERPGPADGAISKSCQL